jgi:hypothetical protein
MNVSARLSFPISVSVWESHYYSAKKGENWGIIICCFSVVDAVQFRGKEGEQSSASILQSTIIAGSFFDHPLVCVEQLNIETMLAV